MAAPENGRPRAGLRRRIHVIIFESDTPSGKFFDVALMAVILLSVAIVMLDSVEAIAVRHGRLFQALEWGLTIIFTIEYLLRLYTVGRPLRFAVSFFGIIDLLAVIPTYLSLFVVGAEALLVLRTLRLLRVFRVLKLARYLWEADVLLLALRSSGPKIIVFLGTLMVLVVITGTMMYLVEGGEGGFSSIPRGVYWAIVTVTTVGYGDIAPRTVLGQFLASGVMILAYSIIAVPTGIITAELSRARSAPVNTHTCPDCAREGHDPDATFCKFCGGEL